MKVRRPFSPTGNCFCENGTEGGSSIEGGGEYGLLLSSSSRSLVPCRRLRTHPPPSPPNRVTNPYCKGADRKVYWRGAAGGGGRKEKKRRCSEGATMQHYFFQDPFPGLNEFKGVRKRGGGASRRAFLPTQCKRAGWRKKQAGLGRERRKPTSWMSAIIKRGSKSRHCLFCVAPICARVPKKGEVVSRCPPN